MEWGEGTERRERWQGGGGGEGRGVGGRCPTLRGCTTWETCGEGIIRWRKRQGGPRFPDTHHMRSFLWFNATKVTPCPFRTHYTDAGLYMDTHTHTYITRCVPSASWNSNCLINYAHPLPRQNHKRKHTLLIVKKALENYTTSSQQVFS